MFNAASHFLDVEVQFLRQLLLLRPLVWHELVQRRIDQTNRHRKTVHSFEDADEVAPLERQQFVERRHARFFRVRQDHFLDRSLAFVAAFWLLEVGKEHVLGAAQADALRSELARFA